MFWVVALSPNLDLVSAATTTHKGVIGMPLVGHVKHGTGEKIGYAMMPTQIRKHVVPRLVVIDTQVVKAVVEFSHVFHGCLPFWTG